MKHALWSAAALSLGLIAMPAAAETPIDPASAATEAPSDIDYPGFLEITNEVKAYRDARLIPLAEWMAKADQDDTLILDTRSESAFRAGHIDGAVNLPFSDFTTGKLAKVVGDNRDRPILIYCNNNFSDNVEPIMSKRAPLALNIPTFINLYGYGYENIYELAGLHSMNDPEVRWIASSDLTATEEG